MLTNNGKSLLRVCGTYNGIAYNLRDYNGGNQQMSADDFRYAVQNPYYGGVNSKSSYVVLGDDDTPEDPTQINLFSNVSTNFTRVGYVIDPNHIVSHSVTFRNDTQTTYTVKEMGFYVWSNYSSDRAVLMTRKVFSTPITMAPNDTRTFNITLDVNL